MWSCNVNLFWNQRKLNLRYLFLSLIFFRLIFQILLYSSYMFLNLFSYHVKISYQLKFFAKTVSDRKPLTPFTKKLHVQCLTILWMHLCTPKVIYYIEIKINIKTGTSQNAECLQTPWVLFSAKFKATANELHQKKTQLRWYEDILLTANCWNKLLIKRVAKNDVNFKIKCKIKLKWK